MGKLRDWKRRAERDGLLKQLIIMNKYKYFILGFVISLTAYLNTYAQDSKEQNHTVVEQMPAYPGGINVMHSFIQNNITYSGEAKEKAIIGTIYVSFVVDSNGTIQDIQLLKGLGYGMDEEALRVIKLMPKWKPAHMNGKNVSVKMTIPVKIESKD